jgi:hypothetical protein
MVLEEGIEPTRPCGHRILSPARLPVPPLELQRLWQISTPPRLRSSRERMCFFIQSEEAVISVRRAPSPAS